MNHPIPIQIRAGDFKPALVGLGKVANPKASLPALQCIRVEPLKTNTVQLSASDLDFHLDLTIEAEVGKKCEPFLVPLTVLRDQVRGTKAGDTMELRSLAKAPPVSEFPEPPRFRATPIPLTAEMSASLLKAFACSSSDTTRYILQGAFLDVSGKGKNAHRIVATDGRQLYSSNSMHLPALKSSVILPDHALWKWKQIADSANTTPWTLRVGTEKGETTPFRIDAKHWRLSGKTISGSYPNYRQVIPQGTDFKSRVETPPEVAEAIADLIPKLPGKKLCNKPVGIHVEKGLVSLLARETTDEPWQFYPIGPAKVNGPNQVVFANRDYVQRAARFGLNGISMIDPQSPLQFSRKGDLMIVMPVRVGDTQKLKRPRKMNPIVSTERSTPPKKSPAKNQVSKKKAVASPPTSDPMKELEARITEANTALATAGKKLKSARGSLNTARDQRSEDQKELKGFRSLFRSIKKLATGSN
ncbi:MAG: DNA polymerase III subunit beta [Verrucomicrobiales bacterium]|nr:DNA polymerase III subunit beta [Verrucomicrobiales bacterium]